MIDVNSTIMTVISLCYLAGNIRQNYVSHYFLIIADCWARMVG